jgi:hypothetical protein
MIIVDMFRPCLTLAAANENLSARVEQHHAHTGAVGK